LSNLTATITIKKLAVLTLLVMVLMAGILVTTAPPEDPPKETPMDGDGTGPLAAVSIKSAARGSVSIRYQAFPVQGC